MPSPIALPKLVASLATRLAQPLPGAPAQARFEPELAYGRHFDAPPDDARRAAVMMLLYERDGQVYLPLALRPGTLSTHGGQIGLPGGGIEPGETSSQAALRELNEELGVDAKDVTLLGQLSPLLVFVSNFYVVPWVAALNGPPRFVPSKAEVAEVIELPLAALADPACHARHCRTIKGLSFTAPSILAGAHEIWGATAMMLAELTAVCEPA